MANRSHEGVRPPVGPPTMLGNGGKPKRLQCGGRWDGVRWGEVMMLLTVRVQQSLVPTLGAVRLLLKVVVQQRLVALAAVRSLIERHI